MSIPHPIPYQGSKRQLAPMILKYFPTDTKRLIEPFAGSGALSLAAAKNQQAQSFILNDINAPLMGLWANILHYPEHLAYYYEALWKQQLGHERFFYDLVRERFNKTFRSHYFLYLLARCVKAAVRYNNRGEFNQSPDNRRKGRHFETMQNDICGASQLLATKTRLLSTDYEFVLALAEADDIVYLDPPFQGVSSSKDSRYLGSFSHERFTKVLYQLNEREISYLISYDGSSGAKVYGNELPSSLNCKKIEIDAGLSSQATLLGRKANTVESLYLSPALIQRLGTSIELPAQQLALFGEFA